MPGTLAVVTVRNTAGAGSTVTPQQRNRPTVRVPARLSSNAR